MIKDKGFITDENGTITAVEYTDGNIIAVEDLHRIAVATVNLPHVQLGPGEVFIKNWSENRGMLASLKEAGIVDEMRLYGKNISSGMAREILIAQELGIPVIAKTPQTRDEFNDKFKPKS